MNTVKTATIKLDIAKLVLDEGIANDLARLSELMAEVKEVTARLSVSSATVEYEIENHFINRR